MRVEHLATVSGDPREQVTALEGLEVVDGHRRAVEAAAQVGWYQVHLVVDVVGMGRHQLAQALPHGMARGDGQESPGVGAFGGAMHMVEGVPDDQHPHHHGLAGAGGHLGRPTDQALIHILGDRSDPVAGEPAALFGFGEPDDGFDRLQLGEKRPDMPIFSGPVSKQLFGRGSGLWPMPASPAAHLDPDVLHRWVQVVRGELQHPLSLFPLQGGLRNRQDAQGRPSSILGCPPLQRPALHIKLPMPLRFLIWGVDHRIGERIHHRFDRRVARPGSEQRRGIHLEAKAYPSRGTLFEFG